jgi:prefoldin subunit 5
VTDCEPAEAVRPTGNIIAFPVRTTQVERQAEDRLTRALKSLNAAMTEQRAAVAAWRVALRDLKGATSCLDESLQRYRTNLAVLGSSVSALQSRARSLEQWADEAASD